jgi:hypothetical protein
MTLDDKAIADFLKSEDKIKDYSLMLKSLWYDGNGDWTKAHDLVDASSGEEEARIHAYLHRKEGDEWNADYWYRRAGTTKPSVSLDEEWRILIEKYWID